MAFNLIGAGRLGKNIALSLVSYGQNQLLGVCNRDFKSAQAAVEQLGCGTAVSGLKELPEASMTFIVTPDDQISSVAQQLAREQVLSPNSMVVHCSGALGSEVLKPLQEQGCLTASFHPFKAFRAGYLSADAFQNCDCVLEGDDNVVQDLLTCFSQIGARVSVLNGVKKSTYHAAAVMASNYVVTLAACALELLMDAGISEQVAKRMSLGIMSSSVANIEQTSSIADALTGPLSRGDLATIQDHLTSMKTSHIKSLYQAAGLATLPLVKLDENTKLRLEQLLDA